MLTNEKYWVDRKMLSNANPCVDKEMLTHTNPNVDREMLTNESPCDDREILVSLGSYCKDPGMLTSYDSCYSKDEGKFWCDTCGHGLADLGSLSQHILEHIVDSMANTNDSHVSHTSHTGLLIDQKPITDDDVKKEIGDTRLGMFNLCSHIVCSN
ncbi:hypothetical protein DPMN_138044 [Dreissena polymorpha]|uniref:C2H2-type domain-containing protein n=1 Tax=Dreissena polymorpha TaxID=45954 RepID=A0A9D4G6K5_DREPO|nr:hypothetical protein DPMN_138044 [Dreissena polymorpha]